MILQSLIANVLLCLFGATPSQTVGSEPDAATPNIIYILADDLGYNEVGCYGQTKIKTPNIDRLAAEGLRFTQHYSGSPVCASSRCTLLTGKHTGHAYVRANKEMGGWGPDEPEGQLPLRPTDTTFATILQSRGYATGAFGKWGLGGPDSTGHPNSQGFDHWYGYLCQRVAHNYYPTHLWRNGEKHLLEGNTHFRAHQKLTEAPETPDGYARYATQHFAPDLMIDEAIQFIEQHRNQPFVVYYATPVPHAAIQAPQDSVDPYLGQWDETPYLGDKGYLPHPTPRAGYAAMVSRMDRDIGRILDLLDDLQLTSNTIVFFSSDNGPTFNGGTDSEFFDSTGPLRGLKTKLYEGGIRVPFIARWPGHIQAGATSNFISAFWDMLPTFCDLIDAEPSGDVDGVSLLPVLLDVGEDPEPREYLYWEYRSAQAVRMGPWKAYRSKPDKPIELYNLKSDIGEKDDVAEAHPQLVERMREIMRNARTESEHFPLVRQP